MIKIVTPPPHHLPTIWDVLGVVVCSSHVVAFSVRQLPLHYIAVESILIQNGAGISPETMICRPAVVPCREWHDANGDQQVAGDYDMPYKLIKRPFCHEPIEVAEMFGRYFRNEYCPKNERQTVPPMWIMRDKLQPWWDPHESKRFTHHYPDKAEE